MLGEVFNHLPPLELSDGDPVGLGRLVFGGYGDSTVGRVLRLSPSGPQGPQDGFHSALWVSDRVEANDHSLMVTGTPLKQLRPAPEPWHTQWTVWRYRDRDHLHYCIAKPNGWEYGIRHPRYVVTQAEADATGKDVNDGQAILASGTTPVFPIGTEVVTYVRSIGRRTAISLNSQVVHDRLLSPGRHVLVPPGGSVGVMTEDCTVLVEAILTWT